MLGNILLYLPILLFAYILFGHILMAVKKRNVLKRSMICCAILLAPYGALYGMLMIMVPIAGSFPGTLLLIPGVLMLLIFVHTKKLRRKRFILSACAVILASGIFFGRAIYIDSIPKVAEFYGGYSPYREDVATLDEPSTFTLTDRMPKLDGATALYPVYAAFYRACYPEFDGSFRWSDFIDCSTTSGAYKNIVNGKADVIFVAGASQKQADYARQQGVELVYTPLGSEAFVFLVNTKNPVDGMTIDEIRSVYRGETTDWSAFGAKRLGKIIAYQREEGSGSQTAFEKYVLSADELMDAPEEQVQDFMSGVYNEVADYKNFKNALGYSFRVYCTELMGGKGIKLLSVNGIAPTEENIINGSYPFAGNFYAVTRSDADETVQAFLNWMQGPQGQELVKKAGYVPLQ